VTDPILTLAEAATLRTQLAAARVYLDAIERLGDWRTHDEGGSAWVLTADEARIVEQASHDYTYAALTAALSEAP
jgi:hypothetical protein